MSVIMYTHVQVGIYIGLCMQVHLCINTFVHIPCIRITPLTGVETKCGFRLAGQQWKPDRAKTCIDMYIYMYVYILFTHTCPTYKYLYTYLKVHTHAFHACINMYTHHLPTCIDVHTSPE